VKKTEGRKSRETVPLSHFSFKNILKNIYTVFKFIYFNDKLIRFILTTIFEVFSHAKNMKTVGFS
jgi:hypothetical protein